MESQRIFTYNLSKTSIASVFKESLAGIKRHFRFLLYDEVNTISNIYKL